MATEDPQLSRNSALTLVIIAVVQSALLLVLHKAMSNEFWPATDPRWLYAAYTVFVGTPAFLYLGLRQWNDRANILAAGIVALILFGLGWHSGWVAIPYAGDDGADGEQIASQLMLAALPLIFMAGLMYRGWRETGDWRRAPTRFLALSWDNALTLGFLLLYLLVFWALLALWAALFELIGIDFFAELFTTPEFMYPVAGLVGGLGLVIIRQRIGLISSVRYLCEALIRALLPLGALIVLGFLLALPFTGLDPLWGTGFGTLLLILISAIVLFAFNADFGGARSLAYPALLNWLVRVAVAVLPVTLALAGWGLWLRVDQYGWTSQRFWALFLIVALAAFALAYLGTMLTAAVRRRNLTYGAFEHWNAGIGIALMIALIIVNTPLLDYRKVAAADQVERLESGETKPDDFDAAYLRFHLGHYGQRALIQARDEIVSEGSDLEYRIERVLELTHLGDTPDAPGIPEEAQGLRAQFRIEGDADAAPTDLLRALLEDEVTRSRCMDRRTRCRLVPLEIDGGTGWAVASFSEDNSWMGHSRLARRSEDGSQWLDVGTLGNRQCPDRWQPDDDEAERDPVVEQITEPAPFLRIGPCAYPLQRRLDPRPMG